MNIDLENSILDIMSHDDNTVNDENIEFLNDLNLSSDNLSETVLNILNTTSIDVPDLPLATSQLVEVIDTVILTHDERLMQSQINSFINKSLSKYLCGYRKGFSTQTALLSLIEKWRNILDQNGFAGAVLIDLSKAFDTINHELLIAKLHAYGFSKSSLSIIFSYLSNRWQHIKIDSSFSDWSEIITVEECHKDPF